MAFTQDATDILEETNGRWFSFNATAQTVVLLEKKSLPDHMSALPCADSPTFLGQVLHEITDSGEAGLISKSYRILIYYFHNSIMDAMDCTTIVS